MILNAILACDINGGIGKNGGLPWPYHKEDMKWFRKVTTDGIVIMGRTTWESIGSKPLQKRLNIVLTKQTKKSDSTKLIFSTDPEHILHVLNYTNSKVWIIGGKTVYEQFLPRCEKLYLTKFKQAYDCDTFISTDLLKPFQKLEYSRNEEDCSFTVWSKLDGN